MEIVTMPCITYQTFNFRPAALTVIETANAILAEYAAAGMDLTLRQLYYQFVARGLIPNKDTEYKRLGSVINDARLAGLIDWSRIEDRTRSLRSVAHWSDPADIVEACASQFAIDRWSEQPERVEVWIEKDALIGVIEQVCRKWDVGYFSCRGYVSQSEMWSASQRMNHYERKGQRTFIIHLGDHDPSGIDMSRDIQDRLNLFRSRTEIERVALNMKQVQQYNPPPNPAKLTDSRCGDYMAKFGDESWELDALEPKVIAALIESKIKAHLGMDLWRTATAAQEEHRSRLKLVSERWDDVVAMVEGEQ
jgi:hypothetical protein